MTDKLSPPPSRDKDLTGQSWQKWFSLIPEKINNAPQPGAAPAPVTELANLTERNHGSLQNINAGAFKHLKNDEYTSLTVRGDSGTHYHDSDRDRANHTGTQSADTMTDGTTNKVFTATDKTRLADTSGTNTGDQTDITGNAGSANAIKSATTTINTSAAAAPTAGQVLTAISPTMAEWQTPATASLSAPVVFAFAASHG